MAIRVGDSRIRSRDHFQKLPLLSRAMPFNAEEIERFHAPIKDFWSKYESARYEPSLQALLSVEREAILAVGIERDLKDINTCRRKILESLASEDRTDYVDLLLTMANINSRQKEYSMAEKILEKMVLADPGNWHALKEYAIVLGVRGETVRALLYFEKAKATLEEYRRKIEVEESETWEASIFETRFRAASVTAQKPNIHEDELLLMLEPIFQLPRKGENFNFYSRSVDKILGILSANKVPFLTVARVFRFTIDGEIAIYKYASLKISEIFLRGGEAAAGEARRLVEGAIDENLISGDSAQHLRENIEEYQAEYESIRIMDQISRAKTADEFEEAAFAARELYEREENMREEIKNNFDLILQKDPARKAALEFVHETLGNLANVSEKRKRAYDFLCVELRKISWVREIHKEVAEFPFAEPVSLLSTWFEWLETAATDPELKIEYLKTALREDGHNLIAKIELARQQGMAGALEDSEGTIADILKYHSDPLIQIRVYSIRLNNIYHWMTGGKIKPKKHEKAVRDKFAEARELFSQTQALIEKIDPSFSDLAFVRSDRISVRRSWGLISAWLNEFETALRCFDEVLKEAPDDERAIRWKGLIYLKQGRFEAAAEFYQPIVLKNDQNTTFRYYYAEALFQIGDSAGAAEQLERNIEIDPRNMNYRLAYARALAASGRVPEAEQAIKEAAMIIEATRKAKQISKEVLTIVSGLLAVARAQVLVGKNKMKEAIAVFREAVKIFAEDLEFEYTEMEIRWRLAEVFLKLNLFDEAFEEARRLLKKYPFFAPAKLILDASAIARQQR